MIKNQLIKKGNRNNTNDKKSSQKSTGNDAKLTLTKHIIIEDIPEDTHRKTPSEKTWLI